MPDPIVRIDVPLHMEGGSFWNVIVRRPDGAEIVIAACMFRVAAEAAADTAVHWLDPGWNMFIREARWEPRGALH